MSRREGKIVGVAYQKGYRGIDPRRARTRDRVFEYQIANKSAYKYADNDEQADLSVFSKKEQYDAPDEPTYRKLAK